MAVTRPKLHLACTLGLASMLVVFASIKLASPYQRTYALPSWAYYASAWMEVAMAWMIVLMYRSRAVPAVVTSFFFVGIVVALLHDGNCG